MDCSKGCERDMEQIYCAALTSLLNYDAPLWVPRFRETFGSCRAAWEAGRKDLAGAGLLSRELSQVWDSARKEALPERIYDYCQKHQVRLLGRWSPGYPPLLAQLSAPPPVLYCKGELPKEESALAIVGSRKATDYGLGAAGQFARAAAAEGVPVISGGAYGIDAAAHRAVLDAGGKTVAVLGGGLEELYPRRHLRLFDRICQEGALVTEYDPWTPPLPQNFPLRNRIIVGLSKAVLVVEAAIRSGAMSTAHAAVDENRELFAVPGPISSETSQGTHRLLKQGARLADDPEEILEFLLGPGQSGPLPKRQRPICSGTCPRPNRKKPGPCAPGSRNTRAHPWKKLPTISPGRCPSSVPSSWSWNWEEGSSGTAGIAIMQYRRRKS